MNIRSLYFMIIAIAACYPARANLYHALRDVYETNPIISQQREAVNVAKMDVKLAQTEMKPYLGVAANAGVARTKIASETFDYVPTQIGVEFQQNIFEGFSTVARIKAAKGILAANVAALYATEQEVFLDAINAYVNVLRTGDVLKLNQNNYRVLKEYYEYCVDLQHVGKLTKTDVAQASARLEMAKYSQTDAQAKYDNSLETFQRIYGKTLNKYDEIDIDLARDLFPKSINSAEEFALKNHPAIIALEAQESAARENITIAYKSILPAIDVRAASMQVDDLPYVNKVRDSRVGVYLKMPLFDRGTAFANTDKARYTVAGIQEQIINARRTVIENLHQAWNMYDAQKSAIRAAESGVAANQMALSGTKEEQKRGRRTVLDVLNAEQELLNTQVSLAQAKYAQVSAFFAVLAATGTLNAANIGIDDAKNNQH